MAFDTSVLVAGLIKEHPRFDVATVWLDALDDGNITGHWTTHAYAETWSVLTRLPLEKRIEPDHVIRILDSLIDIFPPTELGLRDYTDAAERSARAAARSGAIFDALHLVSAEHSDCDALLTFNERDFLRFPHEIVISAPPSSLQTLVEDIDDA